MKSTLPSLPLLAAIVALPVLIAQQHPAHPQPAAPDATAPADQAETKPQQHPLKGVVLNIMRDRQSLLVKHEEVPGVMRAMTMMLKVTPEDLESVKVNQAITGLLSRESDGWWLREVRPANGA